MSPAEFALYTVMQKFAATLPDEVAVEQPIGSKKKPKLPAGNRSPLSPFILPLAAGSLGSLGLANMLASHPHTETMRKSLAEADRPLADNETAMTRYMDILSPGAAATPFGQSVGSVLPSLRSNKAFMELTGNTLGLATPGSVMAGRGHYSDYSKGPLSAYRHQLETGLGELPLNRSFLWKNFTFSPSPPRNYRDLMLPRFENFVRNNSGIVDGNQVLPNNISYTDMNHADQMRLLRSFDQSLSPAMRAERHKIETGLWNSDNKILRQAKNYTGAINAGIKTRDALTSASGALGGAAVGGVAGHYLHRLLGGDPKKRSMSLLASELGGAAVGGVGGYIAAHPDQNFARLLSGILASRNQMQSSSGHSRR